MQLWHSNELYCLVYYVYYLIKKSSDLDEVSLNIIDLLLWHQSQPFLFYFCIDSLFSGNLARQLLDALNEAQDLEQFEANWAVKQVIVLKYL